MKVYISGNRFIEDHLTEKDFEALKEAKIKELTEEARRIENEMRTSSTN